MAEPKERRRRNGESKKVVIYDKSALLDALISRFNLENLILEMKDDIPEKIKNIQETNQIFRMEIEKTARELENYDIQFQ